MGQQAKQGSTELPLPTFSLSGKTSSGSQTIRQMRSLTQEVTASDGSFRCGGEAALLCRSQMTDLLTLRESPSMIQKKLISITHTLILLVLMENACITYRR